MNIKYSETKDFTEAELADLFSSVGWIAGKHPEKLAIAMRNSSTVFSAWDNGKLVGLINVLDDGVMTAYIHFLLVSSEYQGKGVGNELLKMTVDKYKGYLRTLLVSDENEAGFYTKSGFKLAKGSAMFCIDRF